MQLSIPEHTIIESKPDTQLDDLRYVARMMSMRPMHRPRDTGRMRPKRAC